MLDLDLIKQRYAPHKNLTTVHAFCADIDALIAEVERLQIVIDGLNLAATQYSESRDHWQAEAKRYREAYATLLQRLGIK